MSARMRQNGAISPPKLAVAGLFAGIGGLEVGFERTGRFETRLFYENDDAASAVLAHHFPAVPNRGDVCLPDPLPEGLDVLTGGFPCQDLSQAGSTRGIDGSRSGLVRQVFRLLEERRVPWVVLENVPFMLQLCGGAGMRFIVDELERLDYRWAYRIVDSRAFGLPHRRRRVFLIASQDRDPAPALLGCDAGSVEEPQEANGEPVGFYWTEGVRGLGWAVNAIPTLKGGSTVGIPSAPAVWLPHGEIVTPSIEAAERLQGFDSGWTAPALAVARPGYRWKLVGNAVTVDAAEWLARRLLAARSGDDSALPAIPVLIGDSWPRAAFGSRDGRYALDVSEWPEQRPRRPLLTVLGNDRAPLSERAATGFLKRYQSGGLKRRPTFIKALEDHINAVRQSGAA